MTNIRNCLFKFKCPMDWDTLLKTSDSKIRYCLECDRGVHYCETDDELNEALKKNWCVAINNHDSESDEESAMILGEVAPIDYKLE